MYLWQATKSYSKHRNRNIQPGIAIVNTYTLIAVLYCGVSAMLYYRVLHQLFLSAVHLLALIAVLVNFIILQKTKNFKRATTIILTTGTTVVVSLFVTGGWAGTGYLWPFAYLPFVFFLTRQSGARNWVLLLVACCLMAVVLQNFGVIGMPYSFAALLNFFAALTVFSICMFLFQKATINYEDFFYYTGNLMEVSPDACITIDEHCKISYANKSAEQLTGITIDKLIGSDFAALFTEPQKAGELCSESFSKRSVFNFPLSLQNQKGAVSELLVNATTYDDKREGNVKVFVICRDITEQKKIETALKYKSYELQKINENLNREVYEHRLADADRKHKADLLNEAQELAHVGSWEWDVHSNRIEWTDELYRIFGFEPQEFDPNYENNLRPIHPQDREYVDGIIQRALKDKQPFNFTYRSVRPDGTLRTISSRGKVFTDESGNTIRITGTVQDITEQKLAEEAIAMEAAYIKLLQSVAVAANNATVFEDAAQIAIDEICKITGWAVGHLYVTNTELQELFPSEVWHLADENKFKDFKIKTDSLHIPTGKGLAGRIHQTKKAYWITDVTAEENFLRKNEAEITGIKAAFGFPVIIKNEVVAIFEFFAVERLAPDLRLLEVLNNIGIQLSRVIERQQADTEIKESREQIETIFKHAPEAVIVINEAGEITGWNPRAELIFGWSADEVTGKYLHDIMIPERFRDAHQQGMKHFLKTKEGPILNKQLELPAIKKDLSEFDAGVSISPTIINGKYYFIGFVSDISYRKKAEESIKKNQAYTRSLIEASLDPLLTISIDGKITDVNEASVNITGHTRETLIGSDFSDYFTDHEKAREGYRQVFEKGFVSDLPLTLKHTEGKLTDVSYNASVYRDERGKIQGIFAAARDITAQKKLAENEIAEREKESLRIAELEKFTKLSVGRELKMIDLKNEIAALKSQLSKPKNYES